MPSTTARRSSSSTRATAPLCIAAAVAPVLGWRRSQGVAAQPDPEQGTVAIVPVLHREGQRPVVAVFDVHGHARRQRVRLQAMHGGWGLDCPYRGS